MNKLFRPLLLVLLGLVSLSSCKKDEPNFIVTPKSQIIFDDLIDKTTADYSKLGNLSLKIGIVGAATSVHVVSTYTVAGVAKTKDLGMLPVSGGVATLNIPAGEVRAAADGPVAGAGPAVPATATTLAVAASSRTANTYVLVVDAISADNSSERRFFTAVINRQ